MTVGVAVVTVLARTVTSKIAIEQPLCDGVTVVTVLTSTNLTRGKRESKRRLETRLKTKMEREGRPKTKPTMRIESKKKPLT